MRSRIRFFKLLCLTFPVLLLLACGVAGYQGVATDQSTVDTTQIPLETNTAQATATLSSVDSSAPAPAATTSPVRVYVNAEHGYSLNVPDNWLVEELSSLYGSKTEVVFSPPDAEPFIGYFSVSIDQRTIEEVERAYQELAVDAQRSPIIFAGEVGIQYTYPYGGVEIYAPHRGRTFRIATERPDLQEIQNMLTSFTFQN